MTITTYKMLIFRPLIISTPKIIAGTPSMIISTNHKAVGIRFL